MTKKLLLITTAALLTVNVWGQWSTPDINGKIYYNGGNVGIGITSPFSKLHIYDTGAGLEITPYNSAYNGVIMEFIDRNNVNANIDVNMFARKNGSFKFYTGSYTQRLIIDGATGNVGIGTTSPTYKLDINDEVGASINTNLQFKGDNILDGGGHSIDFRVSSNQTSDRYVARISGIREAAGALSAIAFSTETGSALTEKMRVTSNGNVGIGTTTPDYKLDVLGTIRATEIKVETGWSDFVFEPDYKLMGLKELETYIQQNKHLPEIPTEAEVKENGISLGEMDKLLLQKIEELTLYVIDLKKENEDLKEKVDALMSK